jgi:hypothetical protein
VVFGGSLQTSNQSPVAMCQGVMVSAGPSCTANASIDNGSFDPDGDPITITQVPPGPYPLGTTTVRLTVEDDTGATDTCVATVMVVDNTPPMVNCPANIVTTTAPGQCSAVVSYPVPTASDNCPSVMVSCNPASGSTFAKGTTVVNCTATDASGNTASCSFTVMVNDNEPPTVSCPAGTTVSANASCQALIPDVRGGVTALDNCTPAASLTKSQSPTAGSLVGLGTHTIMVTVTDAAGNSRQCQTTLTVIDTTAPTVSCSVSQSVLPTLWPPNHDLVNVGLNVSATDHCDTNLTITVEVFGDEDDEEPTGDGTHSPDAKNIAPGTLRLRSERKGDADGRVYLIVVKATDDAGNVGVACCTVVVPLSQSQADKNAVDAQAASARSHCLANDGAPPSTYFVIGDGPIIGPRQ